MCHGIIYTDFELFQIRGICMNMILAAVWPFNKIQEWFEEVVTSIINGIIFLVEEAFDKGNLTMNSRIMVQAYEATQKISLILIIVLSLKHILETYILELDGDSDSDPLLVLVRNSKAMLVISAGALITNLLVKWSDSLCSYITDSVTYSFNAAGLATALIANIKFGWFSLVFVIVFAFIVLICCLVALIRGVELGLMKILLPIMACNLTSIKQDRWNDFFASFIVVAFGYIVQMILFKLAMTYAIEGDPLALLKSLVCLFFFIKTPNWLQQFAYSSGLKDTARSGMYLGMMMGRRL